MSVPQGDHIFFHLLSVTNKWLHQSGNEAMGMFKWEKKDSQTASLTPSGSLKRDWFQDDRTAKCFGSESDF